MDEKLPIETKRDKFIHTSRYFKPFDMEGDGNCMYHALSIGMNKLDLDGCNNNWNQTALRKVIAEYYTEVHNNENHENNSVWKHFFHTYLKMKISLKESKTMENGEMNQYWLCL